MLNYEILLARGGILVISGSTGYKNEYEKKKKKKKPNPSRGSNDWINKIYNLKDKPDINILTPKR